MLYPGFVCAEVRVGLSLRASRDRTHTPPAAWRGCCMLLSVSPEHLKDEAVVWILWISGGWYSRINPDDVPLHPYIRIVQSHWQLCFAT